MILFATGTVLKMDFAHYLHQNVTFNFGDAQRTYKTIQHQQQCFGSDKVEEAKIEASFTFLYQHRFIQFYSLQADHYRLTIKPFIPQTQK